MPTTNKADQNGQTHPTKTKADATFLIVYGARSERGYKLFFSVFGEGAVPSPQIRTHK